MTLWLLFLSAFISATLFPGGSEATLAYLTANQSHSIYLLILVATLGNTLGGMSSWLVGRIIAIRYPATKLDKDKQRQAVERIQKYGSPVLLLSWLPVIGDPLCVAAGWLRIHWLWSLLFIAIGKCLRYVVVVLFFI